jgi:voltage-gated potassium channel
MKQPDRFENIGQSLWWSVATLTTVGYGDIYPITGLGKVLSSAIALIGIGFVACQQKNNKFCFIRKQREKTKWKKQECPNCGTKF